MPSFENITAIVEKLAKQSWLTELDMARVVYCGAPVMISCVGEDLEMSVIEPRDYWATSVSD